MKLYIKQKVFSWTDSFHIKDETGADRYSAKGEFFSWGRKLHVLNEFEQEIAFIKRELWTFLPRYHIFIGNRQYTLVKEFTFFKQAYRLEGTNWTLAGNFLAHEYEMQDNGFPVMCMSKEWFTWGDSYALDIPNPENALLCLCVALAVDCVMADAAQNSSHSHN